MMRQLFIYYRIPKADIALGLACAEELLLRIEELGLGSGKLFQREEGDKPYFTLMEVLTPAATHTEQIQAFSDKVEHLAICCFSTLPNLPGRHVEIFTPVQPKD